jgi:SAM-dependent methyltransferase
MAMVRGRIVDGWSNGAAYEHFVGRWSRLVAREFIAWVGAPAGLRWLDVGAGTGVLAAMIASTAAPAQVVGVDASEAYVAEASRRTGDVRVRFEHGDACALPYVGEFDVAVSGLVLNFVSDVNAAAAGMGRAVSPGGVVSAYVWDYAEGMEMLRYFWDAAITLDPSSRRLDEGARFAVCRPDRLRDVWCAVRLDSVVTMAIDVPTAFRNFEDYWAPFLGGQGPAPSYVQSLEPRDRAALREALRASLPIAGDGSIRLNARAWAVKGLRSAT